MTQSKKSDHLEATAAAVLLDRCSAAPVYRQIADSLRDAIIDGRLPPGTKLPPTRSLADSLGVARNRVSLAYSELTDEGYLQSRVGAGTFVIDTLPEVAMRAAQARANRVVTAMPDPLSRRSRGLLTSDAPLPPGQGQPRPFRCGMPALDSFPVQLWSQLAQRVWRGGGQALLGYGDPRGHIALRTAIAEHVAVSRSVRCSPEQVLVVSGSVQALDLCARALADAGDDVILEDPGRADARIAFRAADLTLVPAPVDGSGLAIAMARQTSPSPRLICVSPSHQFPLGVSMSLPRRFELLEWATKIDAWIMEDDYDSEFRYNGRPLPSLQGLGSNDRVVYIGSFNRAMFPSLRLGYLVVPERLADAFTRLLARSDHLTPSWTQMTLAYFISEGHLDRHLRRMRRLYAHRQEMMLQQADAHLGSLLRIAPDDAGMHVVGYLPDHVDDRDAEAAAARLGVETVALSRYAIEVDLPPGLLFGYAAADEHVTPAAMGRLAGALAAVSDNSGR